MNDGQSRCEYDEQEAATPQERLKGGAPFHMTPASVVNPLCISIPTIPSAPSKNAVVICHEHILLPPVNLCYQRHLLPPAGRYMYQTITMKVIHLFSEEAPAANSYVQEAACEEPAQVVVCLPLAGNVMTSIIGIVLKRNLTLFHSQVEENNFYEVPAEETADRGICARALYDYQAGELLFFYHDTITTN